ncbi:hypothetical protein IJM86_05985 [bacterium]|nr:hypothetical protein [bacterium]
MIEESDFPFFLLFPQISLKNYKKRIKKAIYSKLSYQLLPPHHQPPHQDLPEDE